MRNDFFLSFFIAEQELTKKLKVKFDLRNKSFELIKFELQIGEFNLRKGEFDLQSGEFGLQSRVFKFYEYCP